MHPDLTIRYKIVCIYKWLDYLYRKFHGIYSIAFGTNKWVYQHYEIQRQSKKSIVYLWTNNLTILYQDKKFLHLYLTENAQDLKTIKDCR